MSEYKLPDVGEGLTEAEIVTWKVKVGDIVRVNDIVVEIETAKSLVELPSPYAGTVQALLVHEGETVPVGTPIIAIGDDAATPSTPSAPVEGAAVDGASNAQVEADAEPEHKTLVGYGPRKTEATRRPRRGAATPTSDAGEAAQQQMQSTFAPGGAVASPDVTAADEPVVPSVPAARHDAPTGAVQVLAKPPVRKLAKDLGVDLRTVTPSGPNGTITRDDVTSAGSRSGSGVQAGAPGSMPETAATTSEPADASAASAASAAVPIDGRWSTGEREAREPVKGVRRMMAQAMVDSAFSAPHVTEWVTVDVTKTMRYVERLKRDRAFADVKVSPLLVVAKAAALAMRRTPEINASWDELAQEVVYKRYLNLGIAAATPRGLVVPNVKGVDSMTMAELGAAVNTLTQTAREGRTQPSDMAGGTFTITNVGVFGVDAGTPIINPGESAILCFGAVRKQPWVRTKKGKDRVAVRSVTTLALSFDHRLVDGEKGSRFLADVAAMLQDPASALLY